MASYYTSSQVDSLISGLSSVYLSISSFNSQIANYVTSSSLATTLLDYLTFASGDVRYVLQTTPLNDITVPDGDLDMNSNKITNLLAPTNNQDAATKLYVD
jgi:hypothetical protein